MYISWKKKGGSTFHDGEILFFLMITEPKKSRCSWATKHNFSKGIPLDNKGYITQIQAMYTHVMSTGI
jgi:hypothetical protein